MQFCITYDYHLVFQITFTRFHIDDWTYLGLPLSPLKSDLWKWYSNNNVKRAVMVMLTHSLTKRQWVTGAQIPDVWKIIVQGCSRHCTAINKPACMWRWSNSAVISILLHVVWDGQAQKQAEWAIDVTPTSWPAAIKVLYWKGINCVAEHQIKHRGPPSKCNHQPKGAQAVVTHQNSCLR